MPDKATASTKSSLSHLVADLAARFSEGVDTFSGRSSRRRKAQKTEGNADFGAKAVELLAHADVSFAAILNKHLDRDQRPISRAEYLFLAYAIQRGAHGGQQAAKERLIELLQLEKELLGLYTAGFPDEHYLITNLNSYSSRIGENQVVSEALDKLLEVTQNEPAGTMLHLDLPARNLLALIEESGCLDESSISAVLRPYAGTLVALASRAIYEERTGSPFPFRDCFAAPVSVEERGEFFSLQVMSNENRFWGLLVLKRSPTVWIPLCYRHFSALAGDNGLLLQEIPGKHPADFVLRLSDGICVYLTSEEAEALREACRRVRGIEAFRSHEFILSFLSGTAT